MVRMSGIHPLVFTRHVISTCIEFSLTNSKWSKQIIAASMARLSRYTFTFMSPRLHTLFRISVLVCHPIPNCAFNDVVVSLVEPDEIERVVQPLLVHPVKNCSMTSKLVSMVSSLVASALAASLLTSSDSCLRLGAQHMRYPIVLSRSAPSSDGGVPSSPPVLALATRRKAQPLSTKKPEGKEKALSDQISSPLSSPLACGRDPSLPAQWQNCVLTASVQVRK